MVDENEGETKLKVTTRKMAKNKNVKVSMRAKFSLILHPKILLHPEMLSEGQSSQRGFSLASVYFLL